MIINEKPRNIDKKIYKWISIYYIISCFFGLNPNSAKEKCEIFIHLNWEDNFKWSYEGEATP